LSEYGSAGKQTQRANYRQFDSRFHKLRLFCVFLLSASRSQSAFGHLEQR